ncbi:lipopolysaccharide biosynthesis protein [Thiocapsa imhoffii]|uniref:lipopolysaccharide biosynthesis protein n=1 Tax=Thiocapsa imhoffii TaxID=382777 RepID=UPI0030B8ACD4
MNRPAITTTLRRETGRIWRSRFARNVAMVASGTAGAQAITMAFAPIITRIYGPEAFGLLGTFMAIVAVAVPLAALAYPIAIVLPKDDRDAIGLVRLSAILSVAIALFAAALLVISGDWLTVTLGAESVSRYLLLIPVAMLFAAWQQIVTQWLIRKKEFGVIARAAIAQSLILNSAKSGIGWLHPVGAVLIVLSTLGQALYAGLLFFGARRRYQRSDDLERHDPRTPLRELAYRHRDFPLYRAPQIFINAASQSLPVLMLAAFFGPAAAGFYTLGTMVMGMPSTLVGKAVNDVFYPRITEAAHNGENLTRHIVRATGAMFAIGVVPFGLVVVFGPMLFSFVFGSDWAMAGEYARWLALWLLAGFINRPSVATIPVLSLQRGFLLYELASVIVRVSAIVLGVLLFQSDVVAVTLFAVVGVVLNLFLIAWVLRTVYGLENGRLHG